jgi:glycosyltransferase 2 family protein
VSTSSRRVLIRALQLALIAAIIWGIYRVLVPELARISLADLLRWRPQPLPLLVSFVLLVAVYVAHAFLWRRIMRDLAIGRPSARATLRVFFMAGLGRYLPGKLWQLAGLALLAKRAGLPSGGATAALLLGQFGFLTTGLLFLGLTLPEWRVALGGDAGNAPVGPFLLGTALLVSGSAALWIMVATPLGHGLRARTARLLGGRTREKVTAAFALADRVRPADAIGWAAGYALTWIGLGAAFVLFTAAFVPGASAAPRFIGGTVAASYLVGYLFLVVPAGIGVREAAMLVLLQRVLPEPGAALVVSVLSRVWFTAAELVPLAFVPVLRADVVAGEEEV